MFFFFFLCHRFGVVSISFFLCDFYFGAIIIEVKEEKKRKIREKKKKKERNKKKKEKKKERNKKKKGLKSGLFASQNSIPFAGNAVHFF